MDKPFFSLVTWLLYFLEQEFKEAANFLILRASCDSFF